eukprot:471943-Prymnesium_polylepis.2
MYVVAPASGQGMAGCNLGRAYRNTRMEPLATRAAHPQHQRGGEIHGARGTAWTGAIVVVSLLSSRAGDRGLRRTSSGQQLTFALLRIRQHRATTA